MFYISKYTIRARITKNILFSFIMFQYQFWLYIYVISHLHIDCLTEVNLYRFFDAKHISVLHSCTIHFTTSLINRLLFPYLPKEGISKYI